MRALAGRLIDTYAGGRRLGSSAFRRGSERFLQGFYNAGTDMGRNGEHWLIRRLASPAPAIAIDVGAHRGDWAAALLAANPAAAVHAFEPMPDNFRYLGHLADGDRLIARPLALSDRAGRTAMRHDPKAPFLSTLIDDPALHPWLTAESVAVETATGDVYCRENGIDRVAFLKIDAEGHDLFVLRGFSGMLDEGRVEVIQFEMNFASVFSRVFLRDFFDLLEPAYAVFRLLPRGLEPLAYDPRLETFRQANFVALSRAGIAGGAFRALLPG